MKMTKKQKVLDHLKRHGSISTWEAIQLYGVTRLSAAIWTLRHQDKYDIRDHWKTQKDRYGDSINYKVYTLEEEK